MIVNKPQFDMNILNPGVAVQVRIKGANRNFVERKYNAIITHADPLKLNLMYWDGKSYNEADTTISIANVVDGFTELSVLEVPAPKELPGPPL